MTLLAHLQEDELRAENERLLSTWSEIPLYSIDADRYGGAYSGAVYTAWQGHLPDGISGGDIECDEFWRTNTRLCGKGHTPVDALSDLLKKLSG